MRGFGSGGGQAREVNQRNPEKKDNGKQSPSNNGSQIRESFAREDSYQLVNEGDRFRMEGRHAEAEAMYLRALERYEQMFGAECPPALKTINNLGLLFTDQGSLPQLETMYLRALEGYQQTLSGEHPLTLNSTNNLGLLFIVQGKLDEAEKMYLRALNECQDVLDVERPSITQEILNLGHSEPMRTAATPPQNPSVFDLIFGLDHPSTIQKLYKLFSQYDSGMLNQAEMAHKWVLEGYISILYAALQRGQQELVLELLHCGAAINASHQDYEPILASAAAKGYVMIVQQLLDADTKGRHYSIALHKAAVGGHETVVQLLLDRGVEIDQEGKPERNPLYAAAVRGHETVVHLLLKRGATIRGWSKQYRDLLQNVISAKNHRLIKLLEDMERPGTLNELDFSDSTYVPLFNLPNSDPNTSVVEQIASFLLEHKYFRSLMLQAAQAESRVPILLQCLRPPIKRYGQDLEEKATDQTDFGIAQELTRHTPYIAEAILKAHSIIMGEIIEKDNAEKEDRIEIVQSNDSKTREKLLHSTLDVTLQLSLETIAESRAGDSLLDDESQRRQGLMGNQDSATSKGGVMSNHLQPSKPALEYVKQFMSCNGESLNRFLGFFSRVVYSDPMEAVKCEFLHCIGDQREIHRAVFHIDWELENYLKQEVSDSTGEDNGSVLESLLVLCGNSRHCFANSCKTYLKWKWPETAEVLLEALQSGLEVAGTESHRPAGTVSFSRDTGLTQGAILTAFGTKDFLVDIAQQASWLTTSLRLPSYGKISYSDTLFLSMEPGLYKIIPLPLQTIGEQENPCWMPLFLGTVIARDYPIPDRDQEIGIELPFHLLETVAGALYPMMYDGGIYLQGHSRLLFPTSLSHTGSIQWHLITSPVRRQKLPTDTIHHHSWQKIDDPEHLTNARTFLGYCRRVVVDLGTSRHPGYYKEIEFSGADDESNDPSIQGPSSFTWGTNGMGIFGATITHPIVFGKALVQTVNGVDDSYLDVLDLAMDSPIILYDNSPESRRGWMVPALSVILHMIHTWAAQKNDRNDQLPYAELTWEAGEAAQNILLQHWDFILRNTSSEEMSKKKSVKDLVMQYWDAIRKRAGENLKQRCQSAPEVHLSTQKLYGWDYMDIVVGGYSCRKQIPFDGNWGGLTENVVLFGQNFGDVIKPAPGISICRAWDPIPSGKMYLTATNGCLQLLSWKHGGHRIQFHPRLADQTYWNHRAVNLFDDCETCSRTIPGRPGNCLKTPQRLDSSADKRSDCEDPPPEGAIVFGSLSEVFPRSIPASLLPHGAAFSKKPKEYPGRLKEMVGKISNKILKESSSVSRTLILSSVGADHPNCHLAQAQSTEEGSSNGATSNRAST